MAKENKNGGKVADSADKSQSEAPLSAGSSASTGQYRRIRR